MTRKVDVLVIGAGPGGYPAAIRSAQLGKAVLLVEKGYLGGECLNWGCIPSKALRYAADFYYRINNMASEIGISVENASINIKKLQVWKDKIVSRLVSGIKQLLKGNKVEYLRGSAHFLNQKRVEIALEDGNKEIIEATNIIIASGAEFISLKGFETDEENILSPKGALKLNHVPENLVIIGGERNGLELATIFAKLGSMVTIIDSLPEILSNIDRSIMKLLERNLKKLGIEIYTDSKVRNVILNNGKMEMAVETKENEKITLTANKILVTKGKDVSTSDLNLEKAGIKTDGKGFLIVNTMQQTNVPHIYAVGDCTGPPFFAHRATKQGTIAAEVIAGEPSEADFRAMPSVIFTDPEIAFAGMTENDAKDSGYNPVTARAPFAASGRAMTEQTAEGLVKVVIDAEHDILLGVQVIGPRASDLISEVALALEMGATAEDIAFTVHPHPTLPEMIMEALASAQGKAIHIASARRRK